MANPRYVYDLTIGENWRGFTRHRKGLVRWHDGAGRWVCGLKVELKAVEDLWAAKKAKLTPAKAPAKNVSPLPPERQVRTYFMVLAAFLKVQKDRVGAKRNKLAERSYHNYATELNAFGNFYFPGDRDHAGNIVRPAGTISEMNIRDIGEPHFTAYAATFHGYAASAFDSVVSRVSAMFNWAFEMEWIDRYKPGPQFARPEKQAILDDRIDLSKRYEMEDLARMWEKASATERCWITLGLCGGMNNADVANLPRDKPVVDLDRGVIDYRRRKSGKKRRVMYLPPDVATLLRRYRRPAEPATDDAREAFFVTEHGNPYARTKSRKGGYMPSNAVTTLWSKLETRAGVSHVDRRNFSGVRTTAWNAWPRGEYEMERKIVFGRDMRGIDMDHYLEDVGEDRVRHCISHVWTAFQDALLVVRSEGHRSRWGQRSRAQQIDPAGRTPRPA